MDKSSHGARRRQKRRSRKLASHLLQWRPLEEALLSHREAFSLVAAETMDREWSSQARKRLHPRTIVSSCCAQRKREAPHNCHTGGCAVCPMVSSQKGKTPRKQSSLATAVQKALHPAALVSQGRHAHPCLGPSRLPSRRHPSGFL